MARHLLPVSGLGSPDASAFVAKVNAALSGLLDKVLISAQFVITDKLPAYTRSFLALIEYEDGGVVQSDPFQIAVIESTNETTLAANGQAFFLANPTSFISPVQFRYSDQLPNVETRFISIYFSCADSVNGAANYQVNGNSGGGGGSFLLDTQVGFGSGANALTGSYDLTWNGTDLYVNGTVDIQNAALSCINFPGQTVLQLQTVLPGDITTLRIVPGAASTVSSFEFLDSSSANLSRMLGVADTQMKVIASDRGGAGTATPLAFRAVNGDWNTGYNSVLIGTNGYTAIYQNPGNKPNPNYPFQIGENGSEWLTMDPTGSFVFNPANGKGPTVVNVVVRASAAQTANLQEWQQSTGFIAGFVDRTGSMVTLDGGSGALPTLGFYSSEKRIYMFGPDGISNTIHGFSFGSNFGNEVAVNIFGRNVGGTRAAPTATQDGHLVSLRGSGWTGVGTIGSTGSKITYIMIADGLWSAANNGTFHQWRDTTFGGTGTAESMRLQRKTLMVGTQTRGLVSKLMLNTPVTTDDLTVAQIATAATTSKGLVIQAVASQTANLQEWQTSTGAVRVFAGPDGAFSANRSGATANEIFGKGAGSTAITGTNNTVLGFGALASATFSEENVAVGAFACAALIGDNTGPNSNPARNTAVGVYTLRNNTGGFSDAFGYNALVNATTSTNNTALGYRSMQENTTGSSNFAAGQHTLRFNTSGSNNTAVGPQALRFGTAISQNTAVGHWAGFNTQTDGNVYVGYYAGRDVTTGARWIAIGHSAGSNGSFGAVTGADNIYIGYQSAFTGSPPTSSRMVALGNHTLTAITSATDIVALGYGAGAGNTSGSFNTYVGSLADATSGALQNATAIGYAAQVTASNQVVLGNSSVVETVLRGFVNYGTQSVAASATIAAPRVLFTGATPAQTLTFNAGIAVGTDVFIRNAASVSVDVAAAGGTTIEGAATLSIAAGAAVVMTLVGTDWTLF